MSKTSECTYVLYTAYLSCTVSVPCVLHVDCLAWTTSYGDGERLICKRQVLIHFQPKSRSNRSVCVSTEQSNTVQVCKATEQPMCGTGVELLPPEHAVSTITRALIMFTLPWQHYTIHLVYIDMSHLYSPLPFLSGPTHSAQHEVLHWATVKACYRPGMAEH